MVERRGTGLVRSWPRKREMNDVTPAKSLIRVLLVDDERNVLITLSRILRRHGFATDTALTVTDALEKLGPAVGPAAFDVVLTDLRMPERGGLELLDEMRRRGHQLPTIVLTGYGTVRSAVEAMQRGAFDFLVKPSTPDEVIAVLRRAVAEASRPEDLGRGLTPTKATSLLVGKSAAFTNVVDILRRAATTSFTVMLHGESGTGKELLARALHASSARRDAPLVAVNCAAMNPALAESQFFGHVKGAFTGAESPQPGFFRAARGGTIFLDEVGDLPHAVQGVLLRVLEERTVTPLGATRPEPLDVRVVSATHQNLEELVRSGRFRADLFYRLAGISIEVPPLRERMDDLPALVEHCLWRFREENGSGPLQVAEPVIGCLLRHDWPGNIRELRNAVERAIAVCDDTVIRTSHLPSYLQQFDTGGNEESLVRRFSALELMEIQQIRAALSATGGEKKAAAGILGVDRKRLYRKMKRLDLLS